MSKIGNFNSDRNKNRYWIKISIHFFIKLSKCVMNHNVYDKFYLRVFRVNLRRFFQVWPLLLTMPVVKSSTFYKQLFSTYSLAKEYWCKSCSWNIDEIVYAWTASVSNWSLIGKSHALSNRTIWELLLRVDLQRHFFFLKSIQIIRNAFQPI